MTRYVGIEEIREISRKSCLVLYGDQALKTSTDMTNNASNSRHATSISLPADKKTYSENVKSGLEFSYEKQINTAKPLRNALEIIQAQYEYRLPFLFRHEALLLSNIKGGASIIQAEKEALRQGLIIKHTLPRAKTNVCFWEITDKGYDQQNLIRPVWRSKGKYKHKFCVYRIEDFFQRQGYDTKIEAHRPNGKLVDLRLTKGENVLYVEVCASWPIEKELSNIQKDLDGDPLPSEIILAVTDRKMRKPLEKAIGEMNAKKELSRPVRIVLAGDMMNFLDVKK